MPAETPPPDRLAEPVPAGFSRTREDLEHFRAGDNAAFERIWRRYRPGLELIAESKIAAVLNSSARQRLSADDVLQDAAITALRKLHDFEHRGPRSLYAWFDMLIARVTQDAIDRWETGKRDVQREVAAQAPGNETVLPRCELADGSPGPVTSSVRGEERRRLACALAMLDERQRRIVMLHYYFGLDWAEIADAVGAPSADAARKEHARMLPELAVLLRRAASE